MSNNYSSYGNYNTNGNGNGNGINGMKMERKRIYPSLFAEHPWHKSGSGRYESDGTQPEDFTSNNPFFDKKDDGTNGLTSVGLAFPQTLKDAAGNLPPGLATKAALAGIYSVRGILWAKRKIQSTARKAIAKWKNRNKTGETLDQAAIKDAVKDYESYEAWVKETDEKFGKPKASPNSKFQAGYEPLGDIYNEQKLGNFEAEPGLENQGYPSPEILARFVQKEKEAAIKEAISESAKNPEPDPDPNNDLSNSLVMDTPEENQKAAEEVDPTIGQVDPIGPYGGHASDPQ